MTGTQGVQGTEGPFPEGNKEAQQKQIQSAESSETPFSFSFGTPISKSSTPPSIFGSERGDTPTDFNFAFSSLSLNGNSEQRKVATGKPKNALNSASFQPRQSTPSVQPGRPSPKPAALTPAPSTNPLKKTRMSPFGSLGERSQGSPSQRKMQPEISSSEEDSLSGSDESDEESEEDGSSQGT